jgi:hypothetical protein
MVSNHRKVRKGLATKLQELVTAHPFDHVAWDKIAAPEIHLRIGNAAPIVGKSAALAELALFFARIESLGEGFWELCRRRETIFAEVDIGFVDSGGTYRRIPCVIVARMTDNSLLDLRFDLDPSPIPLQSPTKMSR